MKRTLIYLAVLAVCGYRVQQSRVSLFGRVEADEPRWRPWNIEAAFAEAA